MEEVAAVTHCKGVNAVLMKAWLQQRHQPDDIDKIHATLSTEAREMLTSPEANRWYPVELVKETYSAMFEVLKGKDPKAIADYGRFSAERSASGLLKFLMRLIDMDAVIKRMKTFWRHYYKGGAITASELAEEEGRKKRIIYYHGLDVGEPGCLAPLGYLTVIGERAGGKNVKVTEYGCIHKGDDVCSWELSWE